MTKDLDAAAAKIMDVQPVHDLKIVGDDDFYTECYRCHGTQKDHLQGEAPSLWVGEHWDNIPAPCPVYPKYSSNWKDAGILEEFADGKGHPLYITPSRSQRNIRFGDHKGITTNYGSPLPLHITEAFVARFGGQ